MLLVVTLVVAGVGGALLLQRRGAAPPGAASAQTLPILGHAFFVSSVQLNEHISSQADNEADKLHFSTLDHMRHLLVESPELQVRGLRGGLATWLLQNTQQVFTLATGARDAWQANFFFKARANILSPLSFPAGHFPA